MQPLNKPSKKPSIFRRARPIRIELNTLSLETPLGVMLAAATPKGLCLLEYDTPDRQKKELEDLCLLLKADLSPGENPHLIQVQQELKEYFERARAHFNVPLHTPGTDFRRSVWKSLQNIPYGKTWSYQQQANELGTPKAVRAVANANGHNRISIIIPCHRVIGSDGTLTGYGGGLHRKKWLLGFEKAQKEIKCKS